MHPETYHFIGIGGIGMSALARLLLKKGMRVSGSDQSKSALLDTLEKEGAHVHIGHSENNVPKEGFVVYTNGVSETNPEWLAALENKCTLLHRSDLLAHLMQNHFCLTVAGTHGKTTTSSLLASTLLFAKKNPSFAVGGILKSIGTNAKLRDTPSEETHYFVAEADESDGSFLKYFPEGSILTNVDTDHLDYYKTVSHLQKTFSQFISQIKTASHSFWCRESPLLKELSPKGFSYGFSSDADLQITSYTPHPTGISISLSFQGNQYSDIFVPLLGRHNALNASAVFGLALTLNIPSETIKEAFKAFSGVKRRADIKYEDKSLLVFDDYAHHPTEIKATLQAIRGSIQERRLIVCFQPHRFSRTKECLEEFSTSFKEADLLYLLPIYSAGEKPIDGITSLSLKEKTDPHLKFPSFLAQNETLLETLKKKIQPHDVIVFMGAGTITKMSDIFAEELKDFSLEKLKVAVLFGGKSQENAISTISGAYVATSLDPSLYETTSLYLTQEGSWQNYKTKEPFDFTTLSSFDLAVPIFHGPYGEDGTIQGFFETLDIPYAGCDFRSASIAMDKGLTKNFLLSKNIPTLPFFELSRFQWETEWTEEEKEIFLKEVMDTFSFPLFVKANHLGSSIGIGKATCLNTLKENISLSFQFDDTLIIEKGVVAREIEVAVFGNTYLHAFPPGEVLTQGNFYDFDAKYGEKGMDTAPLASLSKELQQKAMDLAKQVYKALGCKGWARVDFFLDQNNAFFCNEVNPIPGCTPISLYPKICEANGLTFSSFLNRLVFLALESSRNKKRNKILVK